MPINPCCIAVVACFGLFLSTAEVYAKTPTQVPYLGKTPIIDGRADPVWKDLPWRPLDQVIQGDKPTPSDLQVRYKLGWREEGLYLLAEITDDVLSDSHPDPLDAYWEDDCLEIFVDADASGGIHTNNFNAFAYHLALDNQVVDIAPIRPGDDSKGVPWLFNHHVKNVWRRQPQSPWSLIWEARIFTFDDGFDPRQSKPQQAKHRQLLTVGQRLGFMLAWCDNDGRQQRETFIGSWPVQPVNGDRNRGYIDASVFEPVTLVRRAD